MIDMLLTDPPYNVAITNSQGQTIENDDLDAASFYEFLKSSFGNAAMFMRPGATFYVWYASKTAVEFMESLKESGMTPRQQLIWVKSHFTLGRQDYQWKHEPCLYGWVEGGPHYFIDLHSLSTVMERDKKDLSREELIEQLEAYEQLSTIQYEKKPAIDYAHPTMKPLPLFEKLVRNSSRPGETVLDLFGGSGTTLIACEDLDRTCYMMEYDPHYAEVILQRWEAHTGQKAVKA